VEAVSCARFGGRVSSAGHDVGQKSGLERGELRLRFGGGAVSGAARRLGNRGLGGRARGGFADVDFVEQPRFAVVFAGFAAASGRAARAEVALASSACAAAGWSDWCFGGR